MKNNDESLNHSLRSPILGEREKESKGVKFGWKALVMIVTTAIIMTVMINPFSQLTVTRKKYTGQTENYKSKVVLDTPWTKDAHTGWDNYPRPQLHRSNWQNLNGLWEYSKAKGTKELFSPPFGEKLPREILIPSCIESGLSGISEYSEHNWFRTLFNVSHNLRNEQFLLNFDAIDYEAVVYLNGVGVGSHRGGYSRFTVDITHAIKEYDNELIVFVRDPTDKLGENIPLGKQRNVHGHMFFAPCSGIWQSVWLESVPRNHIKKVDISGDKKGVLSGVIHTEKPTKFDLQLKDNDTIVAKTSAKSNKPFRLHVNGVKLWNISNPHLYNITIKTEDETVESYVGFRSIEVGIKDGIKKPLLNDEFVFTFAPLDEGYWPDGLYTPPSEKAMQFDVDYLKDIGFSGIRKHIKVEPDLFYHYTDRVGMLVWQDAPSMMHDRTPTSAQIGEFERQFLEIVDSHKNFPSIVTWVLYNEGWGQIDGGIEKQLLDKVVQIDSTRLIDAASGWKDNGYGDFHDVHHYSEPLCGINVETTLVTSPDGKRIEANMEMGGVGHLAPPEHNWPDMRTYKETYEVAGDVPTWNFRTQFILEELRRQIEFTGLCTGAVYTQTTDIESEVNGLLSYDRRFSRPNIDEWKEAINGIYKASNSTYSSL
ncbi:hypothetical protein E3Q22_03422 [Wallemia mellicola]|uniref:Glycoside hydrolase n=1 Tax=Wallemia mellicola TaxID=1708541 RepID=A0A4T0NX50_9BASI|nr:hypothetical protein E3Q23_03237 [Wallemia mellicola]TIB76683.1 hypothetical protein E3Q22_03422 [Wallemia mellicola]TIB88635.1 hypothetical protein E3Q19_03282 [Wallemia mellicola]TIB97511.1 hypothetical protein E3Q17_03365 [Wallemia mellicola]TIC01558.1 hypothetical protein E3Q16_03711 [Wallemia mellicola]